jgi:hypothetical protein
VTGLERRNVTPFHGALVYTLTMAGRLDEEATERLAARLAQAWEDLAVGRYHPLTAADVRQNGAYSWTDSIGAREGRPLGEQLAVLLQRLRYIVAEELAGTPLPMATSEPAALEERLHATAEALESGRRAPLTGAEVSRLAADWQAHEERLTVRLQQVMRLAALAAAQETPS